MTIDLDANTLIKRYEDARVNGELWQDLHREAYEYAIPNRNTLKNAVPETKQTPGQKLNRRVYDTTAVDAAIGFTSKLNSILTPPFVHWANLQVPETSLLIESQLNPEQQQQKKQLNDLLELSTDILFKYINKSNFQLAINESYYDLIIGTMSLLVKEGTDSDPFNFVSVPISNVFLEKGPWGTITNVWQYYNDVPGRNILQMWPKAKLSQQIITIINNQLNPLFSFIEGNLYNHKTDKYYYFVIEENTRDIIYKVETQSSEWIVARWSVLPGENYGRGPVINALPSMKSLNEMAKAAILGGYLRIMPPLEISQSSGININNLSIEAGALWPVNNIGGSGRAIQPVEFGGEPSFGQFSMQDLRNQINALLFADALGPIQQPVRTATEIQIRQQNLAEKIGPAFGRLEVELLSKIVKRCVYILNKKGLIPDIKIDGREVEIDYQSPLAKSQDEKEVQSLVQMNQILQTFVGPQLSAGAFKIQELATWLADKLSIDSNLINSPQDVLNAVQQVQQQIGQAQDVNSNQQQLAA